MQRDILQIETNCSEYLSPILAATTYGDGLSIQFCLSKALHLTLIFRR
jgi:hypothetical protein